jgi:thioredoxin-like negative regulator of GroEL
VIDVGSAELEALLREEERLVLVEFWTRRCEPCRELRAQLGELAAESGGAGVIVAVDADDEPDAAVRHRVTEFPTLVFFKRGMELRRLKGGALPPSVRSLLDPSV